MRIRRHAAWSRRGVVGPTKKVLELASPSVSSLQGWRKCGRGRGAGRWVLQLRLRQATKHAACAARARSSGRLTAARSWPRRGLVQLRALPRAARALRPRASVAVPTGTSPSYLPRLSLCPHWRVTMQWYGRIFGMIQFSVLAALSRAHHMMRPR